MTDFSKTPPYPVEDGFQYEYTYNGDSSSCTAGADVLTFISIFALCICTVGLVGNGAVIYLLGFRIKRSPFTTYILNLAVADFGVLSFLGVAFIFTLPTVRLFTKPPLTAAIFMHNTSQLLLTAISIDRCVSVLFPIWHRCHRPPCLSAIVCALMWVLSCFFLSLLILQSLLQIYSNMFAYPFFAATILCLPLVTVSTLILFFKVFCKPQQPRRGRLLTIVLLTLLFFLIFAFPLNVSFTIFYFISRECAHLTLYGTLCATVNSCVNPVIYFLVGRKKRSQQRQSLKVMLQRAFKEEEGCREERSTRAQTSL